MLTCRLLVPLVAAPVAKSLRRPHAGSSCCSCCSHVPIAVTDEHKGTVTASVRFAAECVCLLRRKARQGSIVIGFAGA